MLAIFLSYWETLPNLSFRNPEDISLSHFSQSFSLYYENMQNNDLISYFSLLEVSAGLNNCALWQLFLCDGFIMKLSGTDGEERNQVFGQMELIRSSTF